jgi:hypothetical protein
MRVVIESALNAQHDARLVAEVLDAYEELKRNFYLGGLRLSAVEGGRFSEAVYRILEERSTGSYTPIGQHLDADKVTGQLASVRADDQPGSVRLYIPRPLRTIYDIRNNRDVAHLADGIDPNLQDATYVVGNADWVMAELVRLYCSVDPATALAMIVQLVTRKVPVIQEFDGFLKVLNPELSASEYCLVLLYQLGATGGTSAQLQDWVHPRMRKNLKRTLRRLVDDLAYAHLAKGIYVITRAGQIEVDRKKLVAW